MTAQKVPKEIVDKASEVASSIAKLYGSSYAGSPALAKDYIASALYEVVLAEREAIAKLVESIGYKGEVWMDFKPFREHKKIIVEIIRSRQGENK